MVYTNTRGGGGVDFQPLVYYKPYSDAQYMSIADHSHISGADIGLLPDSHVTHNAQLDATGDKPTGGETTATPQRVKQARMLTLTWSDWWGKHQRPQWGHLGTPGWEKALSKGKKAKPPKPGPVVAQGLSSMFSENTDKLKKRLKDGHNIYTGFRWI